MPKAEIIATEGGIIREGVSGTMCRDAPEGCLGDGLKSGAFLACLLIVCRP